MKMPPKTSWSHQSLLYLAPVAHYQMNQPTTANQSTESSHHMSRSTYILRLPHMPARLLSASSHLITPIITSL